ncbi:MAG: amino acid permease [Candidatus Marinimicrobia bacterium]|nr:amino acid permease [Candidatus Neomarinimicrobiota bacterium]
MAGLKRVLGLTDIVLFNIVAIVGLRWLLTASRTGPSATVLWILALVLFFIPQGLAVTELTTRYPKEGGIYAWAKLAFGDTHGYIAGWCYWVNNLIYYPSLLIFLASNALYMGGARWLGWETNPLYITLFSLVVLWLALGLNIVGLSVGRWVNNIGGFGQWVPVLAILGAGAYALSTGPSATTFTASNIWPDLSRPGTISFWATMCFAFAGLELASVMSGEIKDPRRTIPRGIIISGVMITFIYILGTLSLQVVLPLEETSILSGLPQAISYIFQDTGWVWLGALTALAITVGGTGGVSAWLGATARIPYVAGLDNFLPPALARLHPKYGTPHISLIWQGIFSSLFIIMAVAGSTVKEAYIVLIDATLIIYFIPYLYLFLSLVKLRPRGAQATGEGIIPVPGGKAGLYLVAGAGLFSTVVSIGLSLVPGEDISNPLIFEIKVVGGCLLFLVLGWVLYHYYSPPK